VQGILLVDKPSGWTSFDVVNYVRHIVAREEDKPPRAIKVGHCGTLDPFATGLLVLLIGKDFTRKAVQFSKLDKTYEFTLQLGAVSTTGDPEGEIRQTSTLQPSLNEINACLRRLTGSVELVPPVYSAIKVNGRRSYQLAREGKSPVLEPRQSSIQRLTLESYNYPNVGISADVSSGTYIRSLVERIGQDLQTGAYTCMLRRTRIDRWSVEKAIQPKLINAETLRLMLRSEAE